MVLPITESLMFVPSKPLPRKLKRYELLSEFGGGVDGFDKIEAAARFAAIAERLAIVGNGIEKILDYGLVSADVGHSGG
jgi:hypothetical protein